MVKIKNIALPLLLGIIVFTNFSCSRDTFEEDFNKATFAFNHADEQTAMTSVVAFLNKYKNYKPSAAVQKRLNCDYMIGIQWLSLYSIYYCRKELDKADQAMKMTILFLDKDLARDPERTKSFLQLHEGNEVAEWHNYIFKSYRVTVAPKWFEAYQASFDVTLPDSNNSKTDTPEGQSSR